MGTNIRPNISPTNKYWISKHRYYELKHFCLQYKEWKAGLKALENSSYVEHYIQNAVDTSEIPDPVGHLAVRKASLEQKIALIDDICYRAEPEIAEYLKESVTEGASFNMLMMKGMPCGKDMFYDRYRKFFWLLNTERG